jgi:putative acetyltransferase
MRIVEDDLTSALVLALLRLHLEGMHASSPPGSVFAFDVERLRQPDVTFWTAWDGEALLGCAALKDLGDGAGELKSMRTHPDHLRRGVAAALLEHLIGEAQARGWRRLSLETGSGEAFDAALALYRRRGFVDGPAFGGYPATDFNQFLHLDL